MKPSDVKILAVDDEPMMLETISELFQAYQFQVDTASSGNKAWELIEKNSYDLILSDVRMPDGDGIELAKRVREKHVSTPSMLFMSGFSDLMNEEIYHIGAEGKFSKPFSVQAVRNAIQTCLLTPEAKWAQPLPNDKTLAVSKKGSDVKSLEDEKSLFFGRGGFFIAHSFSPPPKGSQILFTIELEAPTPVIFKGAGIVRWIQNHGTNGVPTGLGIEITSMPPELTKIYKELFGNVTAFIPSPKRIIHSDAA